MEGFTKFLESGGKEGGAPAGDDDDDEEADVSTISVFVQYFQIISDNFRVTKRHKGHNELSTLQNLHTQNE